MKINELINTFDIYMSNDEKRVLEQVRAMPAALSSFSENDQFIIEGLIRKSLVIKIGNVNPKIIANEL